MSSSVNLLSHLFRPDTYKQVYRFYKIRYWEWNLLTRHEFHRRQGWIYHVGQHARPMYLIGFSLFMAIAGIDIVAGMGTEFVGEGSIDKSAQFKQMLAERKDKQMKEKKEKLDFALDTSQQIRETHKMAD